MGIGITAKRNDRPRQPSPEHLRDEGAAESADGHLEGNALGYEPQPINTSDVRLSEQVLELTEQLAENAHEVWAQRRMAEGWSPGPRRDEDKKEHPSLVPYDDLPEEEKEYDRSTAMETLKVLLALGYRIEKKPPGDRGADSSHGEASHEREAEAGH